MRALQSDLFGEQEVTPAEFASVTLDQASPDFIARIRSELEETLATVRQASALPWPDLTRTTLEELRFNSITRWLPDDEATAFRAGFDAEMTRLYEIEDSKLANAEPDRLPD